MTDYPFNPRKLAGKSVDEIGYIGDDIQQVWVVKCPICQNSFNHIVNAHLQSGEDRYQADWVGRGDLASIVFECENCSKKWALCFGFHKGNTFIFYRSAS
jgi:hypothetical protein